ncbi:MAG: hypothetical protein JWO10_2319 [Microbacteriaceae bacterium]|nr:hypothetical protein [Microbacteriaceae bacterium]
MTGTLAELIRSTAARRPDLQLVVDDDAMGMSHAAARAEEFASRLLGCGLELGDRVAMLAPNDHSFIVAWMGAQLAGLELALVNPDLPDDLLRGMFAVLEPKAVLLPVIGRELGVRVLDMSRASEGLLAENGSVIEPGGEPHGETRDPSSIAGYMHTSGTTGMPKFCAQSHDYFTGLGGYLRDMFDLAESDSVYSPLPLFHINPLGYGLMGALTAGSDFHSSRRFSVSGYWPKVVRDGITVLILHGAPLSLLKQHADPAGATGHRVRGSFFGDQEFLQRFGIPLAVTAYGSTEAGGITHARRWSADETCIEPEGQMRTVGQVRPGLEWALLDGEIVVRETAPRSERPGILFDGYLVRGKATDPLDEDGWFHTGDLGRQSEDGGLVFVERASESVRVKGEYVPLEHLEDVLSSALGAVTSAWKRGGNDLGDELVVFVEGTVDLDAYRQVEPTLPVFMRPSAFAEVAALPRDTGLGKVQRRRLNDVEVVRWIETAPAR